jgi:hypothetical protein
MADGVGNRGRRGGFHVILGVAVSLMASSPGHLQIARAERRPGGMSSAHRTADRSECAGSL